MKSMKRAWSLYKHHFGGLLLMTFIMTLISCSCLVPLLAVKAGTTAAIEGGFLSLVIFVCIVMPARQNAARVMLALDRTDVLYIPGLTDTENYPKKVALGLKTLLCMLLWSLPLIVAVGYALYAIMGDPAVTGMDGFTLIRKIMALGGGDIMKGAKLLVIGYVLTLVPIVVGLGFHSGRRHFAAMRKKTCGRLSVFGVWIISLLTFVPFGAVAGTVAVDYLKKVIESVSNIMKSGLSLPPLTGNVYLILAAAVVLLLPLYPLRSLMVACKVHDVADPKWPDVEENN